MSDSVRQWSPSRAGGNPASGARHLPGTTGSVAVVFAALIGTLGALASLATTHHLGALFAVVFVIGCVLPAFLVRRSSALAVVVAPPLLYLVIAGIFSQFARATNTGSGVLRHAFAAADQLVTGAPTIWIATALAAVVVLLRRRGGAAA